MFASTNGADTTPEVLKCNSFPSIKFELESDLDRIHKEGAGGVIMNVFLLNESVSPALGPNLHIRPLIELILWCFLLSVLVVDRHKKENLSERASHPDM